MILFLVFLAICIYCYFTAEPEKPAEQIRVSTIYDAEKAEQDRKQSAKKAQAQRDIETQTERVRLLDALLDNAKLKYERATKDKDIERLTRQIISLEGQIAAAESRIEKAKYIVKYGG